MTRRVVIGGKVMRAPSLEELDERRPVAANAAPANPEEHDPRAFKVSLYLDKDAPRTWARDKAELVALGVNGEVEFGRAVVNADLDLISNTGGVKRAWRSPKPANDNHKIAAEAA